MKDNITTVLFDLDGTLLPFNQDDFIHSYFGRLVTKLIPLGFEKDSLLKGVLAGMNSMLHNDGTKTNEEAFWDTFEGLLHINRNDLDITFREFYKKEFDEVKEVVPAGINRKNIIKELKSKGYQLILATNPLFPKEAVATRLSWIGLSFDDFSYVTTFDNSTYCKPNLEYYKHILATVGKGPKECVMIGNNTLEDMIAEQLGMKVGLVTTNIENQNNYDINQFINGTLEEVVEALL